MDEQADRNRWLERYGDHYSTDEEREVGYRDYLANRADLNAAFGVTTPN